MCGITAEASIGETSSRYCLSKAAFEELWRPVIRAAACRAIRTNYTETSQLAGALHPPRPSSSSAHLFVLPGYETEL